MSWARGTFIPTMTEDHQHALDTFCGVDLCFGGARPVTSDFALRHWRPQLNFSCDHNCKLPHFDVQLRSMTIGANYEKFNVSSLGLAEYHDPTSAVGRDISALIPSEVMNPASITQYIGVKDWYSLHFLSVCSGFFAPCDSDSSILTSSQVNVTCARQASGYIFSLVDILRAGLKPNVMSLADNIDAKTATCHTAPWVNLWYAGIVFIVFGIVVLPLTFSGRRRINKYTSLLSLVSLPPRTPLISLSNAFAGLIPTS